MKNDNGFESLVLVVFSISPQFDGIGTMAQDLVTQLQLKERKSFPYFYMRYLQSRIKIYLFNDNTGHKENLTVKYIMLLSKLNTSNAT